MIVRVYTVIAVQQCAYRFPPDKRSESNTFDIFNAFQTLKRILTHTGIICGLKTTTNRKIQELSLFCDGGISRIKISPSRLKNAQTRYILLCLMGNLFNTRVVLRVGEVSLALLQELQV